MSCLRATYIICKAYSEKYRKMPVCVLCIWSFIWASAERILPTVHPNFTSRSMRSTTTGAGSGDTLQADVGGHHAPVMPGLAGTTTVSRFTITDVGKCDPGAPAAPIRGRAISAAQVY